MNQRLRHKTWYHKIPREKGGKTLFIIGHGSVFLTWCWKHKQWKQKLTSTTMPNWNFLHSKINSQQKDNL